jgi:hypothetical protein
MLKRFAALAALAIVLHASDALCLRAYGFHGGYGPYDGSCASCSGGCRSCGGGCNSCGCAPCNSCCDQCCDECCCPPRHCRFGELLHPETYPCCGCGEFYWCDWKGYPPTPDPCDCCGNYCGPCQCSRFHPLPPRFGSIPMPHIEYAAAAPSVQTGNRTQSVTKNVEANVPGRYPATRIER